MARKQSSTRTEMLRLRLADEIVAGQLLPGTKLDEQELADRFGVSRTPVREALRQLAAGGFVQMRPHRGVVVAALTSAQLAEMFDVLAPLEALAARLSAERMTAAERRQLEALHQSSAPAMQRSDADAYEELNVAFHEAIFRGSHNGFLCDTALGVRARVRPYSRGQFHLLGRLAKSFAEHGRVVEAILRGDAIAAESSMLDHVGYVSDASADLIGNRARRQADLRRVL
jgi:DNA-binding GntR family transcriptional regulator